MPTSGVADIRAWLESRIGAGVRLGLSTCSEMLERLGNPQADFPSIHVAGTNGKGSLCAHLSALGSMNGELIGLFTSPHLVTIEERARIDGRPVSPESSTLAWRRSERPVRWNRRYCRHTSRPPSSPRC